MAEWARISVNTIAEYWHGVQDELFQNRKVYAMMKSKGKVKFNCHGDGFKWNVPYRRAIMSTNNGEQTITFARQDRNKQATLDYAGYILADSFTKREKLKNGPGASQIVDIVKECMPRLKDDMQAQFGEEVYVDSTATGNSERWSGIETMMGYTQTINVADGTARTANAADVVAYPTGTYGSLQETLGYYAGTWGATNTTSLASKVASTWPAGRGDASASYDFYTPIIGNMTTSSLGGATSDWPGNAKLLTRYCIQKAQRYSTKQDSVDLVMMDGDIYRVYLNTLDSKERIETSSSTGLRALGFTDVFSQDGTEITWEYGIPSGVAYGLNFDKMAIRSMQDQMFVPEGPEYDMASQSWRMLVSVLGQFQFMSPRHFFKMLAIA